MDEMIQHALILGIFADPCKKEYLTKYRFSVKMAYITKNSIEMPRLPAQLHCRMPQFTTKRIRSPQAKANLTASNSRSQGKMAAGKDQGKTAAGKKSQKIKEKTEDQRKNEKLRKLRSLIFKWQRVRDLNP